MIIFNKYCCCLPLRQGCLIIGYTVIIVSFLEVFGMMFAPQFATFCERLKKLWYLHDEIKILSGILLLACAHNVSSSLLHEKSLVDLYSIQSTA